MTRAEHGHLSERRLLDVHVGAARVPADARRHLDSCEECRARARRLVEPLDEAREVVRAEADAVFSETRLAAQRTKILGRLAHLHHAARVIPFPAHTSGMPAHRQARFRHGWIAAAAAAGLLLGVGLGRISFAPAPDLPSAAQQRPSVVAPAPSAARPAVETDDEALLLALEELVSRQRVGIEELKVVDALTPRVQEAVYRPK